MRACDSLALFTGYGVQAMTLLDEIDAQAETTLSDLLAMQARLREQTYTYMVPGDVSYILKRAKAKGEKSVGMIAGLAAKTLSITPVIRGHMGQTEPIARKRGADNAREQAIELASKFLDRKLVLSKHICFSYSGDLNEVSKMPSFQSLLAQAKLQGIQVHLGLMSATGAVNVEPNSLSFGLLAAPHDATQML